MPPDGQMPPHFSLYFELFRVPGIGESQSQAIVAFCPSWCFANTIFGVAQGRPELSEPVGAGNAVRGCTC